MENLIGKKIRINVMNDELSGHRYNGKEGVVTMIDSMGLLHGTWGFLAVIPGVDDFSVIG